MKSTDIALVLFMNIAFGASFISAKIGVNYFPPFLFTAMRFLIIAILLLPFLKLHKGQMFNIIFISLLGGAFHFSFFYLALDNSDHISSVAILLQLGTPIATILSVIFLGEIIRWKRLLGILLAFVGVMFITPDSLLIRLSNIETWGMLFYRGAIPFVFVLLGLIFFYKKNFFKALFGIGSLSITFTFLPSLDKK